MTTRQERNPRDMPFSFLAREAGRVHVCGHRGYSLHYPENTLPALQAAKAAGATTVEIDVVLTADGEPIVLHDLTVDRTTDGHGFAADLSLEQIRRLDAGVGFRSRLRRNQDTDRRGGARLGEGERPWASCSRSRRPSGRISPSTAWRRCSKPTGTLDRVIVISFDHVVLKRAVERHPGLRTEAITHARHADIVGVLKACGANSVSIELDMFRPEDAKALHDAGFTNRLQHAATGRARRILARRARPHPDVVMEWIADGLIDSISGDDVPFIAQACRTRRPGWLRVRS